MDKNKLKTFAIESRRQLIEDTAYQANLLGITKDGIQDPVEEAEGMQAFDIGGSKPYVIYDDDIEKRDNLVKEIQDKGFDNVIEEVAYTWFNRIIAIRYMEVNDYLPTRVRVLSSETLGKSEPDIIKEAFNIDLNLTNDNIQYIYKLKEENKNDELFQFLFIKQCNKLNEILPELFEKTQDYTELLLNIFYINSEGIIQKLIDDIPEEDFKNQIEVIGWLYQFYNSDLKDETFELVKNKIKVSKERLPSVTQLFTPDWIVKYMVENSLGRFWIENNYSESLKYNWDFYIDSEINKNEKLISPEDVKVIDPCMGSGHILIYVFDVLMEIYKSKGYRYVDATRLILEKNIHGLEIDKRAYQLAYFSILMKAAKFDKKIFYKKPQLNLCLIKDSQNITDNLINFVSKDNINVKKDLNYLKDSFADAKEFGSLIQINPLNFEKIYSLIKTLKNSQIDLTNLYLLNKLDYLNEIVKQAEILSERFDVTITNPPYMNSAVMNKKLSNYLKDKYPNTKKDLFSVFIERSFKFTKIEGHVGLLTPTTWMFLKSSFNLREYIIKNKYITTLTQLEYNAFPEACVPVCIFSFKNSIENNYGTYIKLSDFKGIDNQEPKTLEAIHNKQCDYKFIFDQSNFEKLPGNPIAYWINNNVRNIYHEAIPLKDISFCGRGVSSHNDNYFLKKWYEVNYQKIGFNLKSTESALKSQKKWFPINKGGKFRKWYGNNDYVVNYENGGNHFKKTQASNSEEYFKRGLTWSRISSSNFSARYNDYGFIIGDAGPSVIVESDLIFYVLGMLNTPIINLILTAINPTLNYQVGNISELPLIIEDNHDEIDELVKDSIQISKNDWDSYETSWDFKTHPFLKFNNNKIEKSFKDWELFKKNNFFKLKNNENKINSSFLNIYNLKHQLSADVTDDMITLKMQNISTDIKSFVSYAVGCMFGRYDLYKEGIVFAGGKFDINIYSKFIPDEDNIIPILDTEYFDDDIVGYFVDFVKVAFGDEYLEENLNFIAEFLNKKGQSSREVIRSYFLSDFFKDHVKMYKKCPIYWLFDSGKENGFKCLVYMHRYSSDLVARVRTDYLHKTQKAIESQISYQQNIKENSGNSKDQARADKRIKKLTKQLDETRRYDEALAHVASQNISIDLDDGVKVNYAKFQNVEVSKEGQKVKKINLLKKI